MFSDFSTLVTNLSLLTDIKIKLPTICSLPTSRLRQRPVLKRYPTFYRACRAPAATSSRRMSRIREPPRPIRRKIIRRPGNDSVHDSEDDCSRFPGWDGFTGPRGTGHKNENRRASGRPDCRSLNNDCRYFIFRCQSRARSHCACPRRGDADPKVIVVFGPV